MYGILTKGQLYEPYAVRLKIVEAPLPEPVFLQLLQLCRLTTLRSYHEQSGNPFACRILGYRKLHSDASCPIQEGSSIRLQTIGHYGARNWYPIFVVCAWLCHVHSVKVGGADRSFLREHRCELPLFCGRVVLFIFEAALLASADAIIVIMN